MIIGINILFRDLIRVNGSYFKRLVLRTLLLIVFSGLFVSGFSNYRNYSHSSQNQGENLSKKEIRWVGTWSTAPQLVEPKNMPPDPGLSNNTLRQIMRVSIGGNVLRVRFTNEFSNGPVQLNAVKIAISKGGAVIDEKTLKDLKFNGSASATIEPGAVLISDPLSFELKPRMDLAITIYFGQTTTELTGHPGSRTTSFLLAGNQVNSVEFSNGITTDHWYYINGIDVKAEKKSAAIAILGNSITDGRGSGTNKQNRWPDIFSECLLKNKPTAHNAVLNMGIGGNCVLKNCLGPAGINRFERDVLNQSGVRWIIIFEAINDIGQTRDSMAAVAVVNDLIEAYKKMITLAHAKQIKIYGATILPFGKSFYYASYREAARKKLNEWIRTPGNFDAIIDFDKVLRDPADPLVLLSDTHMGDYLHPNEKGYQMMGASINLKLFK